MTTSRLALSLISLAACSFPRPGDVGGSDAGNLPIDAMDPPGVTVHVSPVGDDGNDGLSQPVKTLKHALGLAAANDQIANIVLASGAYTADTGETFPYSVPAGVAILGPAGGGAVLVGTQAEPALMIDTGSLKDLDFEDFAVAVVATGVASLTDLRVRTSAVAVRAETTAKLTIDNLDITGATAGCATGIVLNGNADLTLTQLATRGLGTAFDARDQSTSSLDHAALTGDPGCMQPVVTVTTSGAMALDNSLLDGGSSGLSMFPKPGVLHVTLTSTIIRNMKNDGLDGGSNSGGSVTFAMTGGELSGNLDGGQLDGGSWTFSNVQLRQSHDVAMYMQDGEIRMRGCTITGNGDGISTLTPITVDLGTSADLGNNVFQDNAGVNFDMNGTGLVEAVGNSWSPNVQGADSAGRYSDSTVPGPVRAGPGNNYTLTCDVGACALHH